MLEGLAGTEGKKMSITVSDVMGRTAIAVRQDAGFADIVAVMRRFAVGAVTVVDADRRPVGVVSQDDLLLKESDAVRHGVSVFESAARRREHEKAAAVAARDLMTSPAVTVTPGMAARDAARLMHDRRIQQLPVIDPVTGRLAGILHRADLLRVFDRPETELRAEAEAVARDLATPGSEVAVGVENGVVTLDGEVERRSRAVQLVEAIRRLEGVIDVTSRLEYGGDDPRPDGDVLSRA
ncbi:MULTISPECIES: CBS domain-containing protein [unclassified Streptosporangium]|uniref:CBS domain-containing protein n=1 Tax=unclassified Streptosporangium TaxID=2632669 RepID=UPI002E2E284F|nr:MULTISPECIES: CBS domain-containing protein [unclassified Streptosporangium]